MAAGLLKQENQEKMPKSNSPTLIGVPYMPGIMVGMDQKEDYIGNEAVDVPYMPGIMVGMDQKEDYIGNEAVDKAKFLNMSEPI
ncbi:hypothetical protein SteCoe_31962 [Stentor coeruleus]|uniref:Uncharacterized protein n=1 Tax=Stentor coeruleus TaxID=5963 RepID=A0A1R2B037_9CILI|nr:hypothetical protein SteCoe_31962 [Stentor coeruleus]